MTREIKVGDFVKVIKKSETGSIWVDEMDKFVNDGVGYEAYDIGDSFGGYVELHTDIGYVFPLDSLELIEVKYEVDSLPYTNPCSQKIVFTRVDSDETYATEKDALIDHFDEVMKSLVLFRGNFNIITTIENIDPLIEALAQMKYFKLDKESV